MFAHRWVESEFHKYTDDITAHYKWLMRVFIIRVFRNDSTRLEERQHPAVKFT